MQQIYIGLADNDEGMVCAWLNRHAALQAAMQLIWAKTQAILEQCAALVPPVGAKVSGSGLGDCVLVLGQLPEKTFTEQFAAVIAQQGLLMHG